MSKYIKLTDTCNITTGKLDSNAYDEKGKYPFFTCAPEPLRINTPAFNVDAILLAGNNASGDFHLNRYNGEFNAYQRTYVITAKNGYSLDYIYYTLKKVVIELKNKAQGSQTKFLTMQMFIDINIGDIPYLEQIKKVKLLSIIDKQIDLNTKINNELEQLAKMIFDYWFLQFDFPNEEGKPYKSSGGLMEYNDELKRVTPKDWKVVKLNYIADIIMGQSPTGDSYNEKGEGDVFYQGRTDFNSRFPTTRMYTTKPSRLAKKGDILLSVRAPVGDINVANQDCCIGRGLSALRSKKGYNSFLYYLMLSLKPNFDIYNGVGTTFGAINKDMLHNISVLLPSDNILKKFEDIVSKYDNMIFKKSMENKELIELRDWLLPMLMNGQVTFKDMETNDETPLNKEELYNKMKKLREEQTQKAHTN